MISDEFRIYNTSNLKCAYLRWKANGQKTSFKNLLNKCPTDFQMHTLGKNSAYYTTKVPSFRRNKQNFVPSSLIARIIVIFRLFKISPHLHNKLVGWLVLTFLFLYTHLAVFISEVVSVVKKKLRRDPDSLTLRWREWNDRGMIRILPRQDWSMTASLTVLFHPNLVFSARERHDHGRPRRKLDAVKPLVNIMNL